MYLLWVQRWKVPDLLRKIVAECGRNQSSVCSHGKKKKEIILFAAILETSEFMTMMPECSVKTKKALNYSKCKTFRPHDKCLKSLKERKFILAHGFRGFHHPQRAGCLVLDCGEVDHRGWGVWGANLFTSWWPGSQEEYQSTRPGPEPTHTLQKHSPNNPLPLTRPHLLQSQHLPNLNSSVYPSNRESGQNLQNLITSGDTLIDTLGVLVTWDTYQSFYSQD